jgi:regulator of cell morphogenesis and NO signaling
VLIDLNKNIFMGTYMNNTLTDNELTVAQLAITQPGALAVFTRYNIDYCCGGHRSLDEACHRIGLDPAVIRAEIFQTTPADSTHALRPENWSSAFLVDFIIENHHSFVRSAIPEIKALLEKVCERHGNESIELLKIRECFLDLSEELTSHMAKEEMILFPAIKRLDAQKLENHPIERIIQSPIAAMEDEHQYAGDLVKAIRSLSGHYTPPDFACPTFQVTYQKLREFDNDLMKHIHLENNILFERLKKPFTPSDFAL